MLSAMNWITYGEIMSFLYLPTSVKNVILANRLIKTLYAPEDKYDCLPYLPKIMTVEKTRLKFCTISSLLHPGTFSRQYTDGALHKASH